MNKTLTFDHSKTIHLDLCRLTGCSGSRASGLPRLHAALAVTVGLNERGPGADQPAEAVLALIERPQQGLRPQGPASLPELQLEAAGGGQPLPPGQAGRARHQGRGQTLVHGSGPRHPGSR